MPLTRQPIAAAALIAVAAMQCPLTAASPDDAISDHLTARMGRDSAAAGARVVFAARPLIRTQHAYETFGRYASRETSLINVVGGKLCIWDSATGQVEVLLDDPKGAVRDPAVDYDGETIVFAYRRGDDHRYHLHTIRADGTGLRQITDGDYDDVEPCWLPNGEIAFVSGRAQRWVPCYVSEVGTVFRCDRNGRNLRRVTVHVDQDLRPWPLPDGRVGFTRWEYIDRHEQGSYHLWVCNPDGSGLTVAKLGDGGRVGWIDHKPIDNRRIVAVRSHKQRKWHTGVPVIIDLAAGAESDLPDQKHRWRGVRPLRGCGRVDRETAVLSRDPCPITERWFMVCGDDGLYLVDDRRGKRQRVVSNRELGKNMAAHEPMLLARRDRQPVIPDMVNPDARTGTLVMVDFFAGRPSSIRGIEPGLVDRILVLENLPSPVRTTHQPYQFGYGSIWNIKRHLGTFPVESDGSAAVELPAARSLQLVALDKQGRALKRMNAALTVMPGETLTCLGCHDLRHATPANPPEKLLATQRAPSKLNREGIGEFVDYQRDIQPVWDEHCIRCHNTDKQAARMSLTGDRGLGYPHSMVSLVGGRYISAVACRGPASLRPGSVGALASPLLTMLDKGHHKVQLSDKQRKLLIRWIEIGAPYSTLHASDGTGIMRARDLMHFERINGMIDKRCASCHFSAEDREKLADKSWRGRSRLSLMLGSKKRRALAEAGARRIDRTTVAGSFLFNLNHPAKSLILRAPLGKEAGGLGWCRREGTDDGAVFTGKDDPDYRMLLETARDAADRINAVDLPGFAPHEHYWRQMKRFGIVPDDFNPDGDPYDLRQIDARYNQRQYKIFGPE
jgi:hypothetical protein